MSAITVTIQLFGAFRNYSSYFENNCVELEYDNPCEIREIRQMFKKALEEKSSEFNEPLLNQSVFANDKNILSERTIINESTRLVVLPPISGG
ncbi:MAG: MoaD/ThiS family protein [Gammaproteobacteria bacterium]|jgi:molybdopterin converting factor small subunit